MRSFGGYALIATYLVVQLFGQVIHTWSGCEHAHLPGHVHTHAHSHSHDGGQKHSGHKHSHCHHHCDTPSNQSGSEPSGDGWNTGHGSGLAADDCLICHHLALGQLAPSETDTSFERVPLNEIVPRSVRFVTSKLLGPNSPRAPPVA